MPSVLITGCNRGIGQELALRYARQGWKVEGACRDPGRATALAGEVTLHRCDVRHEGEIDELAAAVKGKALDLIINNAGVMGPRDPVWGASHMKDWLEVFGTNSAAPYMITERLLANLEAGRLKQVVNISSALGSLTQSEKAEWSPIYGASKAAVNMATRHLSSRLKSKGITVVSLHPGWVQTDMGGQEAAITVGESASALMSTIAKLTPAMTGSFFNRDGTPLPW